VLSGERVSLTDNVVRTIFNFAKLKKSDIFCHLGCGDGNAVAIAAKEFSVKKSIGIEIDNTIADNARRNVADIKNAYIINKDIRKADISDATVLLFWFSDSDLVDALTRRFRKELKDDFLQKVFSCDCFVTSRLFGVADTSATPWTSWTNMDQSGSQPINQEC